MKRVKRGNGITSYEIEMFDGYNSDDMKKWRETMNAWNADIKKYGGIFGAVSKRAYESSRTILAQEPYTDETQEHSPSEFAELIVNFIESAKIEIENNNADLAARHAFDAGVKWALAQIKWGWEKDALRGEKVAGGQKNSAHKTNDRHTQLREKRMSRMRELVPNMGVDCAANECSVEGLGSADAIKRQYNRWKNKDT